MRILISIVFICCIHAFAYGQGSIVDSLKTAYRLSASEEDKVLILSDIGYYFRLIHPDSALLITQQAFDKARKIKFLRGESNALSSMASVFRIEGDMERAMFHHFKSLRVAQENNYKPETAKAYLGVGTVYFDLKQYDLAIQNMSIASKIYDELNHAERYSTTIANMGEVYLAMDKLDSAVIHLKKPFNYKDDLRSSAILPFCNSRLGRAYLMLKQYDTAQYYALKAIELGKKENNSRVQCYSYQVLAEYFTAINEIDSAIFYSENSLSLAKEFNFNWDVLASSQLLARLYESKKFENGIVLC